MKKYALIFQADKEKRTIKRQGGKRAGDRNGVRNINGNVTTSTISILLVIFIVVVTIIDHEELCCRLLGFRRR